MSAIIYSNKSNSSIQSAVRPASVSNTDFIAKLESILCDKLEGIEDTPGFKLMFTVSAGCLAVMVFDIVSNGALMDLLVTL